MGLRKSHKIFLLKGFNGGGGWGRIVDKWVIKEPELLELGVDGAASGPAWAGNGFQVTPTYGLPQVPPPSELVDSIYLLKHLQNTI